MLQDLFLSVFYVCGSVCAVAGTFVTIKASVRYLARKKKNDTLLDACVDTWDKIVRPGVQVTAPLAEVVKPAQEAPLPEPSEVIECGQCRKEIKSHPIERKPPTEVFMGIDVYRCEHCGATVSL